MDSYNDKVRMQYKMLARVYDFMDIVGFPIKKYNPRLGLAKHIPDERISVLDVCVGTGNSAIAIAAKNINNKVVGIDLSEQMLMVAKNKVLRKQINNVELSYMDATNIDINEQFDVVTTSLSLHEMPKDVMDTAIKEMCRVMKDSGKLYIIEWDKPQSTLGSILFMFFPYIFEPKGFGDFIKLDWTEYLSQHGLKVEGIEKYTFTKLIIAGKA